MYFTNINHVLLYLPLLLVGWLRRSFVRVGLFTDQKLPLAVLLLLGGLAAGPADN